MSSPTLPAFSKPELRDVFEWISQIRLHVYMARIRSAIRLYVTRLPLTFEDDDSEDSDIVQARVDAHPTPERNLCLELIRDEIHNTLGFIGYCTIMGAAIKAPYLLQEIAYMFFSGPLTADRESWRLALTAMNTDFTPDDDDELFAIDDYDHISLWWRNPEADWPQRIDPYVADAHTENVALTIYNFTREEYRERITDHWLHQFPHYLERQPGQSHGPTVDPNDGPSTARCILTAVLGGPAECRHKQLLRKALEKVDQVSRTIDAAISSNQEGIYRSQYRIGLYEYLEVRHRDQEQRQEGMGHVVPKAGSSTNLSATGSHCTSLISIPDSSDSDQESRVGRSLSGSGGADSSAIDDCSDSVEITDWEIRAHSGSEIEMYSD